MILKDWEVFGIPRVRLVEWVVVRSATKPHEKQALLYGRVCQFGNANMSCFLELSNIKQAKRALDLAELSVAPNGIKKGRSFEIAVWSRSPIWFKIKFCIGLSLIQKLLVGKMI